MFLFFFSLSLDFTVNALFFTEETMHKIYMDKGQFNFLYQIPQILYSTLISKFIDSLIKNFALPQENIVELKQERDIKNLHKKQKKLLIILKIKFYFFLFIIIYSSYVFLVLYNMFLWYIYKYSNSSY